MLFLKSGEFMKVTKEMIHPELRFLGGLYRRLCPYMGSRMMKLGNWFLNAFVKGKAFTRKLYYEQVYIEREDKTKLRLCVYRPKEQKENAPALLWIHGGGFAMSVPEQDISFIKAFVLECGCTVISPDYTRSLDSPYPAAFNDCVASLLWMRENYKNRPLCVGGDSAGGSLCAAVALWSRDNGLNLRLQMPIYPMLDYRETPSSADNDAPVWNSRSNKAAWRLYLGGLYGSQDIPKYASPALETDYSGLPPAITYVGDIEPFYCETLTYINNLKTAKVAVEYKIFKGCFHGFDICCPKSAAAKEARRFLIESFNKQLKKDVL